MKSASPSSEVEARGPCGLGDDVVDCLREVRSSLAALVGAVPGPPSRAIDLERALGLDKKLAWQVFRIAHDADPILAGTRVPGTAAVRRLVDASGRVGVASDITSRVVASVERFQGVIRDHAIDRSTFDVMVTAVTGEGIDARNADLKRSAFRTNSQLHGKQCDLDLFTLLASPGRREATVDLCSIRGMVNLCPLRPVATLEIARQRFDHADGTVQRREPIDPVTTENDIALLTQFSSSPRPTIRQEQSPDGFVRSLVEARHLGQQAGTTCLIADVTRESPLRGRGDEPAAIGHIHEITTPSQVLLHDVFIHKDLAVFPDLRVLTARREAHAWPSAEHPGLLPIQEEVHRVGRGSAAAATPELREYPALVEHVMRRLGWDADDYELYRCRVAFPVLNSVVWMRFDLSDR